MSELGIRRKAAVPALVKLLGQQKGTRSFGRLPLSTGDEWAGDIQIRTEAAVADALEKIDPEAAAKTRP